MMQLGTWRGALTRRGRVGALLVAFVVAALAIGFAVSPASAQSRHGSGGGARLTITRVSSALYVGLQASVKINGNSAASLWSGSSTTVPIPPGANRVSVYGWSYPGTYTVVVNARPGGSYAVEIAPRGDSFAPGVLFGLAGGLIDAAANEDKGGAFQMRVVGR